MAPMSAPPRPGPDAPEAGDGRIPGPRAVRVTLAPASAAAGLVPVVVEPAPFPVAPSARVAGQGRLGGAAAVHPAVHPAEPPAGAPGHALVNGLSVQAELLSFDDEHAILARGGPAGARNRVLLLPPESPPDLEPGSVRREVIVEGWTIKVDVEPAARAALRERARRGSEVTSHGGPTAVRAIIPGVVVSVSVTPGDSVTAGQQLLVVEAMKMQNELRSPRDGTIERVAVTTGMTLEAGDLLLVIS